MGKQARSRRVLDYPRFAIRYSLSGALRRPVAGRACAGAAGAIRRCRHRRAGADRRNALRRHAQFRRPADRRLRSAALPAHPRRRHGARRSGARSRAARPRAQGVRLLSADARGGEFRALGARPQRYRRQSGVLSAGRQAHVVPRRLYLLALRPFARLDRRSDAGARRRGRALDMGTPFDFFSPRSWPADPRPSAPRRRPIAHCSPRRCGTAAFGPTIGNGGTSRLRTSRFRAPISIFRSGEATGYCHRSSSCSRLAASILATSPWPGAMRSQTRRAFLSPATTRSRWRG